MAALCPPRGLGLPLAMLLQARAVDSPESLRHGREKVGGHDRRQLTPLGAQDGPRHPVGRGGARQVKSCGARDALRPSRRFFHSAATSVTPAGARSPPPRRPPLGPPRRPQARGGWPQAPRRRPAAPAQWNSAELRRRGRKGGILLLGVCKRCCQPGRVRKSPWRNCSAAPCRRIASETSRLDARALSTASVMKACSRWKASSAGATPRGAVYPPGAK